MDNCFSIFKLSFANHQEYAHELTALGRHYMLYEGMMEKWKEMYPHRILDVYYEDTVTDIEAQCVRMVDFLGLRRSGLSAQVISERVDCLCNVGIQSEDDPTSGSYRLPWFSLGKSLGRRPSVSLPV